jgi:hypothetical protein
MWFSVGDHTCGRGLKGGHGESQDTVPLGLRSGGLGSAPTMHALWVQTLPAHLGRWGSLV